MSKDWNNRRAKPVFFAGVSGPCAVHSHACPITRHGRTVAGPCDCGGEAAQKVLDDFWKQHSGIVEIAAIDAACKVFNGKIG